MMLRLKHCRLILNGIAILTACLFIQTGHAVQTPWGSRLNGFAQHTLLWSDNNNFIAESDDTISSDITDVGFTLTHDFNQYWKFTGQVNSHRAGGTADGDPELDFAYFQWRAYDQPKHQFDVNVGRVVMPYGLNNELRDIAHSRPSILAPQSIYYDRFRSSVFAHEGVGFNYNFVKGFDSILLEGAYVIPRDSKEVKSLVPEDNFQDRDISGQEGYFLRLTYDQPLKAKYVFSSIYLRWDYDANFSPNSSQVAFERIKGGFDIGSTGISIQQHFNAMTLTFEFFRHTAHYRDLLPSGDLTINLDAKLMQLQTNCGPIHCLLQYEQLSSDRDEFAESSDTKDIGAGISWKAATNLVLRTEYHYVDGIGWLDDTINIKHKQWHYIATQVAWAF